MSQDMYEDLERAWLDGEITHAEACAIWDEEES